MNEDLSFTNSNVGNTVVKITDVKFDSVYKYTYEMCDNNICNPKTDIITPNYLASNKSSYLMILDYEFNLDKNSIYSIYNSDFSSFVTNYLKIRYVKDNKIYFSKAISRTTDKVSGQEVVQIDRDVIESDEIQLVFTIRNRNHIIVLK